MRDPKNFSDVVDIFIGLVSSLIPLIFALTLFVIIWKVTQAWIIGGGDETKIEEGKKTVMVGVLVLVVMSGIWGILEILRSSLF